MKKTTYDLFHVIDYQREITSVISQVTEAINNEEITYFFHIKNSNQSIILVKKYFTNNCDIHSYVVQINITLNYLLLAGLPT